MKFISWFRHISLGKKLTLMVLVPLIGLFWFSQVQIRQSMDLQSESESVLQLVQFASMSSEMVHELQKERGMSAAYLGSKGEKMGAKLLEQRKQTDARKTKLLAFLEGFEVEQFGSEFVARLDTGLSRLKDLKTKRALITDLKIPLGEALGYYTGTNGAFLSITGFLSQLSANSEISNAAVTYYNFLQGKERAGIERAVLANTFASNRFGSGMFKKFVTLQTEQNTYITSFLGMATSGQRQFFEQKMKDPAVAEVESMRAIAHYAAEKSALASQLGSSVGYGGLIHHFQSYLLTGEANWLEAYHQDRKLAEQAIARYEALPGITQADKEHIDTIRMVLGDYNSAIEKAVVMLRRGDSIAAVERSTRVSDEAAIQAIATLSAGGFGIDSAVWFDSATRRINLLKSIEDNLADGFTSVASDLNNQATSEFTFLLLITIGSLGITLVLSWIISSLITGPIKRAVNISEHISLGDLSDQIEAEGTDETSQLLSAMKSMQEQLTVVIKQDVQTAVDAAKKGDLSVRVPLENKAGFYQELGQSINDLIEINDQIIHDTGNAVSAMANGDLTVTIDTQYQGSFDKLKKDVTSMQDMLSQVIETEIQNIVDSAGHGDLSQRINLDDKSGVYKRLSSSINDLVDLNDSVIQDVGTAVGAMANGDLSTRIETEYEGSFGELKENISTLQSKISDVIEKDIQLVVEAAVAGDLSRRIDVAGKSGFYERLSSSINELVEVNDRVITDVSAAVGAIASGDLTRRIEADYKGSFGSLKDDIGSLQTKLADVIERDIQLIVEAAVEGDLSQRIDVSGKSGFYKALSASINNLVNVSDKVILDTIGVVSAMANGDLTKSIDADYNGSFEQLKNDVNKTIHQITTVVTEIQDSSALVKSGSEEIASGNLDLSQRTEEQAASLEETSSAMEEMTSTTRNNAQNAKAADDLAREAWESAEKGGHVVSDAVAAMDAISQSSNKISDIISVIDEIAFQTNLLSLNASVEAARAGDQGRGFAVVADEVRNLAGRSATAAKEIKGLIDDSTEKVEQGSRLVNKSGETLDDIVTSVKKVSDIVAEISHATNEQAAGIDEVNKAINQMDDMTQQNAALVEEAAAASESLGEQSVALDEQISFFEIGGSGDASLTSDEYNEPSVPVSSDGSAVLSLV